MKPSTLWVLVGGVIAFALLIVVVAACGWFGLRLDSKISIIEVLTLLAAVLIAILLQYHIGNKLSVLRSEKDLLILNVREALSSLKSCQETFISCQRESVTTADNKRALVIGTRGVSNAIWLCEKSLGMSQLSSSLMEEFWGIKSAFLDFKSKTTGGQYPLFPFTSGLVSDQTQAERRLTLSLNAHIFKINSHH